MKINFIVTGLFRSGGMRVIFEYGNRLTDAGHDVKFYYPLKPYYFGNNRVTHEARRYYWSLKEFLNRNRFLKNYYTHNFSIEAVFFVNDHFIRNADVTIATQWPTAYSVYNLANAKGKKVYFIQGYEFWNSDLRLVDYSYRLNLHRITVSNYLKDLLLNKFGADSYVVLDSIDFDLFENQSKTFSVVKTITFIDHYLEIKGVPLAIEVVNKLHEKYNNLQFQCFGYQKYHSLPNFVKFFENPNDEQIQKIYLDSDIFIFSSLIEGFGLPPAEAMACKCAVVTTKVGAVPEYSINRNSAIHVTPNNVNELFDGVCYLLDNESELTRISNEGFNMVRSSLSWDNSVERFEKYLSII